mmetsp:Transcript_33275/g.87562  ORF Transcript_33275/g.87562 Transcript_33275/m.87562 type:complete len:235 (-) Transcript_33275:217-921(-)
MQISTATTRAPLRCTNARHGSPEPCSDCTSPSAPPGSASFAAASLSSINRSAYCRQRTMQSTAYHTNMMTASKENRKTEASLNEVNTLSSALGNCVYDTMIITNIVNAKAAKPSAHARSNSTSRRRMPTSVATAPPMKETATATRVIHPTYWRGSDTAPPCVPNGTRRASMKEATITTLNQPVQGRIQNARTWNSCAVSSSRTGLANVPPSHLRSRRTTRPKNLIMVNPATRIQ